MNAYRKDTDSLEKRAKFNENKRKRRAALNTPEKKFFVLFATIRYSGFPDTRY